MSGTMEADEDGLPVRCLLCGKDKGEYEAFMHEDCWFGSNGEWEVNDVLAKEWEAGARNFPRPRRPTPGKP